MNDEVDALSSESGKIPACRLQSIATAILADPQFAKSPVLGRLLRYLVDQTVSGNAASLKSYAIATDCLGRPATGSSEDDAYARVVVGRLRKALREHHKAQGQYAAGLRIAPGSYEVEIIEERHVDDAEIAADGRGPVPEPLLAISTDRPKSRRLEVFAILALLGALVGFAFLASVRKEQEHWANADFPTVALGSPLDGLAPAETRELAIYLEDRLAQFPGVRVLDTKTGGDFKIVVLKAGDEIGGGGLLFKVVRTSDQRVISSRIYPLGQEISRSSIDAAINDIAGPLGAIHSFNRRNLGQAGSPYKCWLVFTGHLTTVRTTDEAELPECASKWFKANPGHPMAISLYVWTQVDVANRERSDAQRMALLKSMELQISDALILNPKFGALHLVNLRVKAALRDRDGVMRSAEQLRRLSSQNSAFSVYAAMFLSFWQHPQAERLLNDAEAASGPSPHVAVGRFALALAADDPVAAGKQISGVQAVGMSQPALRIIEAAYHSRIGKTSRAHSMLTEFCRRGSLFGMTPEVVMRRIPVDHHLRRQLWRWLEPAMRHDPGVVRCKG